MIATRGYGRNGSARGGLVVMLGFGRNSIGTLLRMRYTAITNRRRVVATIEGRNV